MKKKAFTLTELLVVVVIIGVLSAVVLPKFNKVIESRRTAEAESVMRAVRNEQEMRCTLDKNYTVNKDNLAVWPKRDSANYTYALNKNGMSATRKDKDYTLEIKTYLDGGICCQGPYCSSLNKDYPSCEDYEATPNTKDCVPAGVEEEGEVAPSRVSEPEPEPICEPTRNGKMSYTEACPNLQVGSLTLTQVGSVQYTWDENLCDYVEVGNNCVCKPSHNGQSSYTEDCTSPQIGSYTYTWDTTSCSYTKKGSCSYCKPTHNGQNSYTEDCPSPQVGSITYTWSVESCRYTKEEKCAACQPTHNGQSSYTEDCPSPQVGSVTYRWDMNTCEYEVEEHCSETAPECQEGDTRGSQSCYTCGTRTTEKCINGKWTQSPGTCSVSSIEQCPQVWQAYVAHDSTIPNGENFIDTATKTGIRRCNEDKAKAYFLTNIYNFGPSQCPAGAVAGGPVPSNVTSGNCRLGLPEYEGCEVIEVSRVCQGTNLPGMQSNGQVGSQVESQVGSGASSACDAWLVTLGVKIKYKENRLVAVYQNHL